MRSLIVLAVSLCASLALAADAPKGKSEMAPGKEKAAEAKAAGKEKAAEAKEKAADAKAAVPAAAGPEIKAEAMAELKDASGKSVGMVHVMQMAKGCVVHVMANGLPEGDHAIHVHETGKCEAPFKTAGGHFNPATHKHGIASKEGHHAGDLPNLHVKKGCDVELEYFTDAFTLEAGKTSLFDADGSAFVVHAGADDYSSDPAGNAGDRIACGVVTKK